MCSVTSAQRDNARDAFLRAVRFLYSSPVLSACVSKVRAANGQESIEFHNGSLYLATNTKIVRYDNVEIDLIAEGRGPGRSCPGRTPRHGPRPSTAEGVAVVVATELLD